MAIDDSAVFFNPLGPDYAANPYPHLAEMREKRPVQKTLTDAWALFRYDDVFRLLRDPSLSVEDRKADLDETARAAMFEGVVDLDEIEENTSMLNVDPPDHTRLRRLVSKAFTPRTIEELRPRIEELVDRALGLMAQAGISDVVEQLAFQLPFEVISEMLGLPEGDKDQLRGWSEAIVKTFDPIISPEEIKDAFEAGTLMDTHISKVIEWKRDHPADDLLTALLAADDEGDRLTHTELRDQVSLLFIAGHETTVNLIGTGIFELMRNDEQRELLRTDSSLDPIAIDELLRFVSPVQFSRRISTADIEFGGVEIPARSMILAGLAAANRDPEQWGDTADELDLLREGAGQHLSFGSGAHHCLGASLAKLEGQAAIGAFIRRFPDATVVGEPQWNGRINLRGLSKLVVDVAPG